MCILCKERRSSPHDVSPLKDPQSVKGTIAAAIESLNAKRIITEITDHIVCFEDDATKTIVIITGLKREGIEVKKVSTPLEINTYVKTTREELLKELNKLLKGHPIEVCLDRSFYPHAG